MPLIDKPGKYSGKFVSLIVTESQKGTPCVQCIIETPDGTAEAFLYLSDAAAENTMKRLSSFGWNGDFETLNEQLTGQPVVITVEEEEYQGELLLKVKWVNPPPKAADADMLKKLSERAKALGIGVNKQATKRMF